MPCTFAFPFFPLGSIYNFRAVIRYDGRHEKQVDSSSGIVLGMITLAVGQRWKSGCRELRSPGFKPSTPLDDLEATQKTLLTANHADAHERLAAGSMSRP